jgi:hypothetical protein
MSKQTYVKLVAKSDSWFKEGTEIYSYDSRPYKGNFLRVTKEDWEDSWERLFCRGVRVVDDEIEAKNIDMSIGEKYWDGECCSKDEFEFIGYIEE